MNNPSVLGRPEGIHNKDRQGHKEADRHCKHRREREQWILKAAMPDTREQRNLYPLFGGRRTTLACQQPGHVELLHGFGKPHLERIDTHSLLEGDK